jgi:divalent metal cation (Fe/Co/Zn/Cd) transporter
LPARTVVGVERPPGTGSPVDASTVRLAVRLEYATVGWNVMEVFVTIGLGIAARSLALVAFGLDSLVEIFASSVVLWQLRSGGRTLRAMALVAAAFLVLGVVLLVAAARSLASGSEPSASPLGIAYLAVTASVMFGLATWKRRVGRVLGNHPLATEAGITFLDGLLASGVLVALLANAAFGAWWADGVAAALIGVVAMPEALHSWRDSRDPTRMAG